MPNRKLQSDMFKQTAREQGADESENALDRFFGKLDLRKKPERQGESDQGSCGKDNDDKDD